MEIDQGDLADIVRASGSGAAGQSSTTITTTVTTTNNAIDDWKYPSDEAANFPSNTIDATSDEFGDPFMAVRDPLLHELDLPAAGPVFFDSQPYSTGGGSFLAHKILADSDQRMIKTPPNMFSRMLQISPSTKIPAVSPTSANSSPALMSSDSPRGIKTSSLVMNDMIQAASTSGVCMVDSGGMQISSARNPGIKRRKSQAKKVVCIPAPAAANNRPTGEVVPSDLWAWRKYGQKPIKGSPYPRGYYRCSSSKGCSARKQVERSRTDPNMLVITYTSEHNHPWPTQRNALAGSTRSQPIKNTAAASSKGTPSANTQNKPTVRKEEPRENNHQYGNTITSSTVIHAANDQSRMTDEMIKEEHAEAEKAILDPMEDEEIVHGFQQSYKPVPLADSAQPDDFFFDLAELEPDPLNLIFCQGLSGEKHGQEKENKAEMDPFSLFDWSGNSFGDS